MGGRAACLADRRCSHTRRRCWRSAPGSHFLSAKPKTDGPLPPPNTLQQALVRPPPPPTPQTIALRRGTVH